MLLSDLEWGEREECYIEYQVRFPPSGVRGGMGGGLALDGLWLHKTIEDLDIRGPIQEVLAGSRAPSEVFREALLAIGPAFAPGARNPKRLQVALALLFHRMGFSVLRSPVSRARAFGGFGVACWDKAGGLVVHGRCAVVEAELAPQIDAVLDDAKWLSKKDAKPPLVAVFTTLPSAAIPAGKIATAASHGVGIVPAESLEALRAIAEVGATPTQVVEALRGGFVKAR